MQSNMFRKNSQQWAGFLIFIILMTQYLQCAARIHFHKKDDGSYAVCPKSYGVKDLCSRDEQPREKRIVGAVLMGISIFLMLANIAFDIYLQIEGCCGLFPVACDYAKEFEEITDDLKMRADRMNTEYTISMNLLEYISRTNQNNGDIWVELSRILILTERVITRIDPKLLTRFNNQSMLLKNALEAHNRTVMYMNNAQISLAYNGIFSSVETAAMGLGPILGVLGWKAITAGIQWYKSYKIGKQINEMAKLGRARSNAVTTRTGMGPAEASKLSQTSTATTSKSVQAASTASKLAKFAGVALSVVSIGIEIYTAIKKIKACETMRDEAKRARDKVKPEQEEFGITEQKLKAFHADLEQTYADTRGNLTNEQFLNQTLIVLQLAQGADSQPDYLQKASQDIIVFHDQIKSADKNGTLALQRSLISAFQAVDFSWNCFEKKVSTMTYVQNHCEAGSNSIRYLFDTAVEFYNAHSASCVTSTGHRYTTFVATEEYVKGRMRQDNLYEDCILNNEDIRYLVCSQYAQGYENEELQKNNNLDEGQVKEIISKCPPAEVSPRIKDLICSQKVVNSLAKTKETFSRYNQQQVESAYNECPPPELPQALKDLICYRKNSGYSENQVVNEYSQYDASAIRTHYSSCPIVIPNATKKSICDLKLYSQPLKKIQEIFSVYPPDIVADAYNECP